MQIEMHFASGWETNQKVFCYDINKKYKYKIWNVPKYLIIKGKNILFTKYYLVNRILFFHFSFS